MECYGLNEFVDNTVAYVGPRAESLEIKVQSKNIRRNGSGGDVIYDVHYFMKGSSQDFEVTQTNMLADKRDEVERDLADYASSLADRLKRALPEHEIKNVANQVTLVSKDL